MVRNYIVDVVLLQYNIVVGHSMVLPKRQQISIVRNKFVVVQLKLVPVIERIVRVVEVVIVVVIGIVIVVLILTLHIELLAIILPVERFELLIFQPLAIIILNCCMIRMDLNN